MIAAAKKKDFWESKELLDGDWDMSQFRASLPAQWVARHVWRFDAR